MSRSFSKMRLSLDSINPTGRTHSASVIFLHGSGDTGFNLKEWVDGLLGREMSYPHIKIIYPTSPLQRYTPFNGELSTVWFDRESVSIDASENRNSMSQIYIPMRELLHSEVSLGIPLNRIIIGGFSMGGALAMHTAFHLNNALRGVFACSSFLNHDSIVYESLRKNLNKELPELCMFHGDSDTVVPLDWGQISFNKLKSFGVKGQFTELPNVAHELVKNEVLEIENWISLKLPSINDDKNI